MNYLTSTNDEITDKFSRLNNRNDIADLLEVKLSFLIGCLYIEKERDKYFSFEIPKRNGKTRTIDAPNSGLKNIQRRLNEVLSIVYTPNVCSHGFIKDRNIVTNAKIHVNKRNILNLDLENFFPSINFGRIRGLFISKPYSFNNEVATTLAQIACYDNKLPQGVDRLH